MLSGAAGMTPIRRNDHEAHGRPSAERIETVIKTLATALVAVSLLAAPALAQGNAPMNTASNGVQHAAAVKTHHLKKHAALRKHVKHVKHAKHVQHAKRHVKHSAKAAS